MSRIAIFSDLHLGMTNYGSIGENGIHSRFEDFEKTFEQFLNECVEEDVDIVIFGGDAFKLRNPPPYQLHTFLYGIKQLINRGIKVIAITGNHDIFKTEGYISILKIMELLGVEVITEPSLNLTDGVPILALPYQYDKSVDYLDKEIDKLIHYTKGVDKPFIGIGHYGIEGATLGGEQGLTVGKDMSLPQHLFSKDRGKDIYWFMGHYHKHQQIAENITYIGSMDRVDFGECEEDKGWILVDYDHDEPSLDWEFKKNDVREMNKININITENTFFDDIVKGIEDIANDDSLNWVIINYKTDNRQKALSFRMRINKYFSNSSININKVELESDGSASSDFQDVEMETLSKEIENFMGREYDDICGELLDKHEKIAEGGD